MPTTRDPGESSEAENDGVTQRDDSITVTKQLGSAQELRTTKAQFDASNTASMKQLGEILIVQYSAVTERTCSRSSRSETTGQNTPPGGLNRGCSCGGLDSTPLSLYTATHVMQRFSP